MSAHITDIMQGFAKDVRNLLGSTLDSVIVYGSYARGDYDENSDIDIIIVAKNIKSLLIIGAILEALKQVLKKEVDLIEEECFKEDEMDELEQEFYDTIKKERVMIYG